MTLAPVDLVRDPTATGAEPLKQLPPWIPPGPMGTYWHQPRSAYGRDDGSLVIHAWCGPTLFRVESQLVAVEEPPPDFRCGTCLGRRLGYDRAEGAIFQPRDHWKIPAYCPGWPDDDGDCLACGARIRWYSHGYSTSIARHQPSPALLERCEPCPSHGWTHMRTFEQRLVCGFFCCGHDGGPR